MMNVIQIKISFMNIKMNQKLNLNKDIIKQKKESLKLYLMTKIKLIVKLLNSCYNYKKERSDYT